MLKMEKVFLMIGMAIFEAVGIFALICGIFAVRVEQIGGLASLGYVVGLSGIFFGVMLICQKDDRKPKYREKHS